VWRICGFDAVYIRDELVAAIPGQALQVPVADLRGYRRSYRMLSYLLSLAGYAANTELPGADRPDLVRALEQEIFGWAGVEP
jgi:hypothetical protein